MSDPGGMLQNLQLEDMPVTRSQAQAAQRASGTRGRANVNIQPPLPMTPPIVGHTRIRYNIQQLSPTSTQRVRAGLASNFSVDRIQNYVGNGRNSYFAFQLRTPAPAAVRIHYPVRGHSSTTCYCDDFQSTQAPCVHIYWLFDSLNSVFRNPQLQTLLPNAMTSQIAELYPLIERQQASLANGINNLGDDEPTSDSGDPMLSPDGSDSFFARRDDLCDILSSFDVGLLPDEFRRLAVDNTPAVQSLEDCFVPDNLYATIYRVAIRDEGLYQILQSVVPRERRAIQYHTKLSHRARLAIRQLSEFAQTGDAKGPTSVPQCASALRQIVNQICSDRDARTRTGPLRLEVAQRLAVCLVQLVEDVCERNVDLFVGNRWNRVPPPGESERDRNLYASLIGNPPTVATWPRWMNDSFVVDRLRGFPANEWNHLFERLTTIKDHVIDNADENDEPASLAYAEKIDEMLREYALHADEPSSSSAQMRMREP